jgi:uncharacterized protein
VGSRKKRLIDATLLALPRWKPGGDRMTSTEVQNVLQEVVTRIVERFHPERIVLFGSYARETAGPDSDADLMVVMDAPGSKRRTAVEIDLVLQGIPIPTDVVVVTPEEFEKYGDFPGTIIRDAMHEGRVLYDRAA